MSKDEKSRMDVGNDPAAVGDLVLWKRPIKGTDESVYSLLIAHEVDKKGKIKKLKDCRSQLHDERGDGYIMPREMFNVTPEELLAAYVNDRHGHPFTSLDEAREYLVSFTNNVRINMIPDGAMMNDPRKEEVESEQIPNVRESEPESLPEPRPDPRTERPDTELPDRPE